MKALKEAGAIALSDDGRPVVNTRRLLEALEQAPALGLVVTAHCEDLYLAAGGLMNEGEVSPAAGGAGNSRRRRGLRHRPGDCRGGLL